MANRLPAEVWTMIAKELKREPPPAGQPANWNDDFHQQDLVSLQRVDKRLYQIASAVLYDAPTVQNMGLFLQGIEKPFRGDGPLSRWKHDRNNGLSVPYHKKKLLSFMKKLYIIHTSSRDPMGQVVMLTQGRSRDDIQLGSHYADMLGFQDLRSWITTSDLIRSTRLSGYFGRLKSVSFGTWDTGRWSTYQEAECGILEPYDSDDTTDSEDGWYSSKKKVESAPRLLDDLDERLACPEVAISSIVQRIFRGTDDLVACYNARALVELDFKNKSIMVVHNAGFDEIEEIPHHVTTRIYATTEALGRALRREFEIHTLRLDYDDVGNLFFRQPTPDSDLDSDLDDDIDSGVDWSSNDTSPRQAEQERQARRDALNATRSRFDLEICLVPAIEGDKGDMLMARMVRDALKAYEESSRKKDGTKGYIGKLKILAGDDIPACPCCGGRR